jgi:hypothetical protein
MKDSIKNKLIAAIIESKRPWKYREIQKWIWNLNYPNEPFTRDQRGYYSTNMSTGFFVNGYLLHSGDGRIYRTNEGYLARWNTKEDVLGEAIRKHVKIFGSRVRFSDGRNFNYEVDSAVEKLTKNMVKIIDKKLI